MGIKDWLGIGTNHQGQHQAGKHTKAGQTKRKPTITKSTKKGK